jgi:hypothetical protein
LELTKYLITIKTNSESVNFAQTLIEIFHYILLVALLTNDGDSRGYTGYELDWIRQHQKENREKIKKYAKMKKKINKLSKKNRVTRRK